MKSTKAQSLTAITVVPATTPARRLGLIGLLGWISMLGVDFFLHAGLLAALYTQPSQFLRPPTQAFALIPLGYASFLLITILLVWLMAQLIVIEAFQGFMFGLKLGALMWGAVALGLLSISTADLSLIAGWFAGQSIEMAIAGAFVGAALGGARLTRLFAWVVAGIVLLVIITIAMQSLGLAPAVRI